MTKEYWAAYSYYTKNIENYCWEKHAITEDITDNFTINLGNTNSSDEDSSNGNGDGDSGSDTKDERSFMSDFIPL
jgi:hypothetical protein